MSLCQKNIFCCFNVNNPPLAVNYIILLGKQFVYKCKLHKIIPKPPVFIRNINDFIKIEFIIASKEDKVASHFSKWDGFL